MTYQKMYSEDIKDLLEWKAQGVPQQEMAKRKGVSTAAISLALKKHLDGSALPMEGTPETLDEIASKRKEILLDTLMALDAAMKMETAMVIAPLLEKLRNNETIKDKEIKGLETSIDKLASIFKAIDKAGVNVNKGGVAVFDQRQIQVNVEAELTRVVPLLCDGCKAKIIDFERNRLDALEGNDVIDVDAEEDDTEENDDADE